MDELVWQNIIGLLQKPDLIRQELDKRASETKKTDPILNQKAFLEKQKVKLAKAMDKLLDAYQEGLVPIDQLRRWMPDLQKRATETVKQLQDIGTHEIALGKRLELLDIAAFTRQMEDSLEDMDIQAKRKIMKLLINEILVDIDTIHIRHSIPVREVRDGGGDEKKSYKVCTWSDQPTFG